MLSTSSQGGCSDGQGCSLAAPRGLGVPAQPGQAVPAWEHCPGVCRGDSAGVARSHRSLDVLQSSNGNLWSDL